MNIIFLDIDGVINSKEWHESELCKSFGTSVKRYFDPKCVALLNRIVEESSARIIISSSWRLLRNLQELQDLFHSVGFTGKIYGKTPVSSTYDIDNPTSRGAEIQEWLDANKKRIKSPIRYVILDDEDDFLEHQYSYFFQTNPVTGLDTSLTEKVISFFR